MNYYLVNVHQEICEECPHMTAGVYFLHFYLRVHITVIQKIDVCILYLENVKNVNSLHNLLNVRGRML